MTTAKELLENFENHNCGNPDCPIETMREALKLKAAQEEKDGIKPKEKTEARKESTERTKKLSKALDDVIEKKPIAANTLFELMQITAGAVFDGPMKSDKLLKDPVHLAGIMIGATMMMDALGHGKSDSPLPFGSTRAGKPGQKLIYDFIKICGRRAASNVAGSLAAVVLGAVEGVIKDLESNIDQEIAKTATKH